MAKFKVTVSSKTTDAEAYDGETVLAKNARGSTVAKMLVVSGCGTRPVVVPPVIVPTNPGIVWQATHECGDLSEWLKDQPDGTFDAADGTFAVVDGVPGAHGKCLRGQTLPGLDIAHCKAFRFYETDTKGLCLDGWWGARMMLPTIPTFPGPPGANIQQIKSVDGMAIVALFIGPDGPNRVVQFHRYNPDESWLENLLAPGVVRLPESGEWFHSEIHFKWHMTDGLMELYWNGVKVAGKTGIRTIPNAKTPGAWGPGPTRWGIGPYKCGPTNPDVVTLYMDDVTLSSTRVGPV